MSESEQVPPVKKTEEKPKNNLGDYLKTGGPGRPPGLKNRFTRLKEQMLEVWDEEQGKEKFRELFKGAKFEDALDKIIKIMPKEIDVEASMSGENQEFFYKMAQKAGLLPPDKPDANGPSTAAAS